MEALWSDHQHTGYLVLRIVCVSFPLPLVERRLPTVVKFLSFLSLWPPRLLPPLRTTLPRLVSLWSETSLDSSSYFCSYPLLNLNND